jgi:hypothetical protein
MRKGSMRKEWQYIAQGRQLDLQVEAKLAVLQDL